MIQAVAGAAERHQIFRLVAASLLSRHDVVHFQKTCSATTGRLAAVLVASKHLTTHSWRDGGRVAASVIADSGIAAHPFGLGLTQLAFTCIGLDGHPARGRVFVDMDLDRRSA